MTSERRILCVYHATQREDRVSRMLGERDFMLDWVNPARGESLPEEFDRYLAVVVYGGEQSVNADTPAMLTRETGFHVGSSSRNPTLGFVWALSCWRMRSVRVSNAIPMNCWRAATPWCTPKTEAASVFQHQCMCFSGITRASKFPRAVPVLRVATGL
jgi:hypothetical protein